MHGYILTYFKLYKGELLIVLGSQKEYGQCNGDDNNKTDDVNIYDDNKEGQDQEQEKKHQATEAVETSENRVCGN